MTTVSATITNAMKLAGVLEGGETPPATDMQDALSMLNNMLESWGTERQSIYSLVTETFALSGQASYTIGEDGTPDFATERPIMVDPSSFIRIGNEDTPLWPLSQAQYNAITLKSWAAPWPNTFFYDPTYPNGTLYFYPVDSGGTLHLVSQKAYTRETSLAATLAYPPGYQRAIEYSLAEEICAMYGQVCPPKVEQVAMKARRNIKRANVPALSMATPLDLLPRQPYNIYTDSQ